MKNIGAKIKRMTAAVMAVVCMISAACCVQASAATDFETAGKQFYCTGFNTVVKGLVEGVPVVGPYASDAVAGFVSSVLGLSVEDNSVDTKLTEMNNKLNTISEGVSSVKNILIKDSNTRKFEESITAIDTVCDDYLKKLIHAYRMKKEKELSSDIKQYEQNNLSAIIKTTCNSNEYKYEIVNLGKYFLGNGAGQTKGALNAYYDYCKTQANFGIEAERTSEKYNEYAMNVYSRGVFSLISGLLNKKNFTTLKADKEDIDTEIKNLSSQYNSVVEKYNTLKTTMTNERLYGIKQNVKLAVDTDTVELKDHSYGSYKKSLEYDKEKAIAAYCPSTKTLREYLTDLGITISADAKYLAVSDPSETITSTSFCSTTGEDRINVISLDNKNATEETKTFHSFSCGWFQRKHSTSNSIKVIVLKQA